MSLMKQEMSLHAVKIYKLIKCRNKRALHRKLVHLSDCYGKLMSVDDAIQTKVIISLADKLVKNTLNRNSNPKFKVKVAIRCAKDDNEVGYALDFNVSIAHR